MATLTVKISQSGTTYDITGNSLAGHVWLSVDSDGISPASAVSMGFAPRTDKQGKSFAVGDVHPDDDQKYLETYYTGTIVISDSQYSQLIAFANAPENYGFSTFYNVLTNSCIDFSWKGLEVIGLNSIGFEGDPWPSWNADDIDRALYTYLFKGLTGWNSDWASQGGFNAIYGSGNDDDIQGVISIDIHSQIGANAIYGGGGNDTLTGTVYDDKLFGGNGNDFLYGLGGNDSLEGGQGNDTYLYTSGDGFDTILDSDGQGGIAYDGATLSGGSQYGDARVHRDADKHLYVDVGQGLVIDGNIMIKDYQSGNLNINLTDAVAETNPQTTLDIVGDLASLDIGADALGNIKTDPNQAEANREDILYDSTGNDHILSGDGNDTITAFRGGNDLVETGAGQDIVNGGEGNDVIIGGADGDILAGEAGDDRIYADDQVSIAEAIANGNTLVGNGLKGDWLAGGSGDDTLVGSIGNDVLTGGSGQDLLIGGAGDDDILGDTDWVATGFDWSVTTTASGTRLFEPAIGTQYPVNGGADVIYAGEGNDRVSSGIGNDVIFGEGGDDILIGKEGNDIILGGAGQDIIWGDANDDILSGGMGNDTLRGGEGKDTYIFNRGDGRDIIYDTLADGNVFRFGAGISSSDITLRLGSFMLDLGNGDQIHIENFNSKDVFNSSSIQNFEFADGSVLTSAELIARGFDLDGTNQDDTIVGTNTTDRITGLGGNDRLDGGAGADILTGGIGNDVYIVDTVSDVIIENSGEGTDTVQSSVTYILATEVENLTLTGASATNGTGNELANVITGNNARNNLLGGAGNDTLNGGGGNDTLEGGLGNDILDGGLGGTDTFVLKLGSGQDVITGSDNLDVIVFGAGISIASVVASSTSQGLLLSYGDVGDEVLITGDSPVRELRFADGTNLTVEQLSAVQGGDGYSVMGTTESETLVGASYWTNYFEGGPGNDTILGGGNDTTYYFNLGDGQDNLIDLGGYDTLVFGPDVNFEEVFFDYSDWGNYSPKFKVHYGHGYSGVNEAPGGRDEIFILDGEQGGIERFVFADGSVFSFDELAALQEFTVPEEPPASGGYISQSGESLIVGTSGDDEIDEGENGDVIYVPGEGNDTLQVYQGNYCYVFNLGGGQDIIDARRYSDEILFFGTDIDRNSISVGFDTYTRTFTTGPFQGSQTITVTYTDLLIAYGDQGDTIRVKDGVKNDNIESYVFADGSSFTHEQFLQLALRSGIYYGPGEVSASYGFNLGDGGQYIDDTMGVNTVQFGVGVAPSDLTLRLGSLLIRVGDDGDELHIADFNPDEAFVPGATLNFRFADGTVLTYNELIGRGFDLEGSARDDVITGTNTTDRIYGYEGNDTLTGGIGADYLDGGSGNDTLFGGAGSDEYYFGLGSGSDTISDLSISGSGDVNTVYIDFELRPEDIIVTSDGSHIILSIVGTDDKLIIQWDRQNGYFVQQVQFDNDGTVWDGAMLEAMAIPLNVAPILVNPIADQNGVENHFFSFQISADTFHDTDSGDVLSYTAILADGSPLPAWLSFNAATGTFAGTPGLNDAGRLSLIVTATDQGGMSANSAFNLNIANLIEATAYNDTIIGAAANDYISTGAGNDTVNAGDGNDVIVGGTGSDLLAGGAGDDIFLIAGNDTGYDRFEGDDGIDLIQGGAGDDLIRVNNFSGVYTVEKIDGGLGNNILAGTQYNDTIDLSATELVNIASIDAGVGNDTVIGSAGNDVIVGGSGSDLLAGGAGDDIFLIAGNDTGYDRFEGDDGIDLIQGGAGDDLIRVNNFSGVYTVEKIDGGLGNNILAGTQYNDTIDLSATELVNIASIDAGVGNDNVIGSAGNDVIVGGTGSDLLAGGAGDDIFLIAGNDTGYDRFEGDDGIDLIQGGAGDDLIRVNNFSGVYTVEKIDGGLGNNILAGTQYNDTIDLSATELVNIASIDAGLGNDNVIGSAGNDVLGGGVGNDKLYGYNGNDILQGGNGNDTLSDTAGTNLLDGGMGVDTLTGAAGNELFAGGAGNDIINTGDGEDVVVFNRNDGQDILNGGIGTDNTLSLGGGIEYSDLALSKSGNDLILEVGNSDQITLSNWYNTTANHKSVLNLQVIADVMAGFDPASSDPLLNKSIQNYDFTAIVNAFDHTNGGSANFMHWSATDSLLTAHLSASDSEALGGDLANQYGKNGNFSGFSQTAAQDVLSNPAFGANPQLLHDLAGLSEGIARLS